MLKIREWNDKDCLEKSAYRTNMKVFFGCLKTKIIFLELIGAITVLLSSSADWQKAGCQYKISK